MKVLLFLSLVLITSGCATIFQPGPNAVLVSSNPPGANVYLDNKLIGQTPMQVPMYHSEDGIIKLEKDGYESMTIENSKVMSGAFLINVLTGPGLVIGMPVDLITHSQGHYSETPIYGNLKMKPVEIKQTLSNR